MFRLLSFLIATLSFSAAIAQPKPVAAAPVEIAPIPEVRENHIGFRIDPIWLVFGGIGTEFDVRVSKKISLGIGGYYIPSHKNNIREGSQDTAFDTDYKWSAYEVWTGPTIMITGDYDHHGLFVSPGIGMTGAKITEYSSMKWSGTLDVPEARVTMGYQWIVKHFRFTAGGGIKAAGTGDIVVKDETGAEVAREKSSTFGGLALDLGVGMVF